MTFTITHIKQDIKTPFFLNVIFLNTTLNIELYTVSSRRVKAYFSYLGYKVVATISQSTDDSISTDLHFLSTVAASIASTHRCLIACNKHKFLAGKLLIFRCPPRYERSTTRNHHLCLCANCERHLPLTNRHNRHRRSTAPSTVAPPVTTSKHLQSLSTPLPVVFDILRINSQISIYQTS